eukprot:TRINITY_DN4972_c0_g2_i7.p1 TRINITY_DN4972_c0_g2~~TRINITY_DN4972_c0_g2_i7.p1  ORF type:complete len:111 (+),score=15.99 TRINITY_DN4972_c0_g2_i7:332-664(+)
MDYSALTTEEVGEEKVREKEIKKVMGRIDSRKTRKKKRKQKKKQNKTKKNKLKFRLHEFLQKFSKKKKETLSTLKEGKKIKRNIPIPFSKHPFPPFFFLFTFAIRENSFL